MQCGISIVLVLAPGLTAGPALCSLHLHLKQTSKPSGGELLSFLLYRGGHGGSQRLMNWQVEVRAILPNFLPWASYTVLLPGGLLRGDSAPKEGLCFRLSRREHSEH